MTNWNKIHATFETLLTGLINYGKLEDISCSTLSDTLHLDIITDPVPDRSFSSTSMLYIGGNRNNHHQTVRLIVYDHMSVTNLKSCQQYRPTPGTLELHYPNSSQDVIAYIADCVSDFSALKKLVLRGGVINHPATFLASKLSYNTML